MNTHEALAVVINNCVKSDYWSVYSVIQRIDPLHRFGKCDENDDNYWPGTAPRLLKDAGRSFEFSSVLR